MRAWLSVLFLVALSAASCSRPSDPAAPAKKPAASLPRLVVQSGHSGPVSTVASSADGRLVATGGGWQSDGSAIVWDGTTGKQLWKFQQPAGPYTFEAGVRDLAFSPSGRLLAALYSRPDENVDQSTSELEVWDLTSGKSIFSLPSSRKLASICFGEELSLFTGREERAVSLWNLESQKEVRQYTGLNDTVDAVAASGNGRWVAASARENNGVCVWDVANGQLLRSLDMPARPTEVGGTRRRFLFAPASHLLMIWGEGGLRLWDAAAGTDHRWLHRENSIWRASLSPDERWVITQHVDRIKVVSLGSSDTVRAFNTKRQISRLRQIVQNVFNPSAARPAPPAGTNPAAEPAAPRQRVSAVDWLPSGDLAVLTSTGTVEIFAKPTDIKPSRVLHLREWPKDDRGEAVRFRSQLLLQNSSAPRRFRLRSLTTDSSDALLPNARTARLARFDTLGAKLLLITSDGALFEWKHAPERLPLHQASLTKWERLPIAVSADATRLAVAKTAWPFGHNKLELWDTSGSAPRQSFLLAGDATVFGPLGAAALERADGSIIILRGEQDPAILDLPDLTVRTELSGHTKPATTVAYLPDSHALTGSLDQKVRLWNATSGELIRAYDTDLGEITAVGASSDGKFVLAAMYLEGEQDLVSQVLAWNRSTGELLRRIPVDMIVSRFSPDGRRFCTGIPQLSLTIGLWDVVGGKKIADLNGYGATSTISFSSDSRFVACCSDGPARIWDAETGQLRAELAMFEDGNWAVRFDSSQGGNLSYLHWVIDNEAISLSQLRERYYEPGLLAKILGWSTEPLRVVETFSAPEMFPRVQLTPPRPNRAVLGIRVTNRGGGIGRVVVKIGGKEKTADARPRGANPNARGLELQVDLSNEPLLKPGEPNRIQVYAFNAAGYLSSPPQELTFTPPARPDTPPPRLWAILIGVSDFRGDSLNLRYASKDAEDFAKALGIAAERLFQKENVHIQVLNSAAEMPPTRANIQKAFADITRADPRPRPDDILVIYVAGHGINWGGAEGDFYLLTRDALSTDLRDPVARRQAAISSAELTDLIKRVPALKQVLILDTCSSGRFVEQLTEKRDVPSSQRRALDRLQDRTGVHVLAGCAADRVSFEATRYAQGLLTYSLLLGMRGAALRDDEFVDVSRLFAFASDRVPELAKDIGGIQRPLVASPQGGGSFDIGQLTLADKALVPVQTVRPLILRANFQDDERLRDHLRFTRYVNECLREASARGRDAPIVFVDAQEFPDAFELVGRYRLANGRLQVNAVITRADDEIKFAIEGSADQLRELADRLVRQAQTHLQSASP